MRAHFAQRRPPRARTGSLKEQRNMRCSFRLCGKPPLRHPRKPSSAAMNVPEYQGFSALFQIVVSAG
jgi:hypothetical protein